PEDAALLGEELPVDVLALVEGVLRERRGAGDRGVDPDADLGVGHARPVDLTARGHRTGNRSRGVGPAASGTPARRRTGSGRGRAAAAATRAGRAGLRPG